MYYAGAGVADLGFFAFPVGKGIVSQLVPADRQFLALVRAQESFSQSARD